LVLKIFASTIQFRRQLMLGVVVLTLYGCGTNTITVEGNFPAPLVNTLPLTLGVYYDDIFIQHRYEYKPKGMQEAKLIMNTGDIQVTMFNNLLSSMFEKVVVLPDYSPSERDDVDLILVPEVDDFQHAIPNHTKINVFEIWMRYRLKLFDRQGEPVADWIMSSYGKTPTAFFQSGDAGINAATIVALRDAGANFALNFARVPEVKLWLEENLDTESAGESP
jgi:hypothetical protein